MGRRWNLDDFLQRLQAFKSMGPMDQLAQNMPGLAKILRDGALQWDELETIERILRAMTLEERLHPDLLQGEGGRPRLERIGRDSGTSRDEVEGLIWQFETLSKVLEQVSMDDLTPESLENLAEQVEDAMDGGREPWQAEATSWTPPAAPDFEPDAEELRAHEAERAAAEAERALRERLDEVLARLSEVGLEQLSAKDRAFLEHASAHLRKQRSS